MQDLSFSYSRWVTFLPLLEETKAKPNTLLKKGYMAYPIETDGATVIDQKEVIKQRVIMMQITQIKQEGK